MSGSHVNQKIINGGGTPEKYIEKPARKKWQRKKKVSGSQPRKNSRVSSEISRDEPRETVRETENKISRSQLGEKPRVSSEISRSKPRVYDKISGKEVKNICRDTPRATKESSTSSKRNPTKT